MTEVVCRKSLDRKVLRMTCTTVKFIVHMKERRADVTCKGKASFSRAGVNLKLQAGTFL